MPLPMAAIGAGSMALGGLNSLFGGGGPSIDDIMGRMQWGQQFQMPGMNFMGNLQQQMNPMMAAQLNQGQQNALRTAQAGTQGALSRAGAQGLQPGSGQAAAMMTQLAGQGSGQMGQLRQQLMGGQQNFLQNAWMQQMNAARQAEMFRNQAALQLGIQEMGNQSAGSAALTGGLFDLGGAALGSMFG